MIIKTSAIKILTSIAVALSLSAVSYAQDSSLIWDGVYSIDQASRGETVYKETCVSCHGQDLGGNSNSPGLVGMGFMFLWEGKTLGEFFEKIRSDMPTDRPGQLTQQNYLDVLAYILLQNNFPSRTEELSSNKDILKEITISSK
jgi:cytochrome c|tara:strand:+ start:579 stop:1010 length:432 start_codon:yes stop_codon:yes gene_type:complete